MCFVRSITDICEASKRAAPMVSIPGRLSAKVGITKAIITAVATSIQFEG